MVSPLVEYVGTELAFLAAYTVFGKNNSAKVAYNSVDAVIYLRVYMVRTACKYDDRHFCIFCKLKVFVSFSAKVMHMTLIFGICTVGGM